MTSSPSIISKFFFLPPCPFQEPYFPLNHAFAPFFTSQFCSFCWWRRNNIFASGHRVPYSYARIWLQSLHLPLSALPPGYRCGQNIIRFFNSFRKGIVVFLKYLIVLGHEKAEFWNINFSRSSIEVVYQSKKTLSPLTYNDY